MRYWPALVLVLSSLNLIADASARSHRLWTAIAVNLVCSVAWAVLLGRPGASLSRMVSVYGIATYVLSVLVGVVVFGEALSVTSRIGVALGMAAVALLAL